MAELSSLFMAMNLDSSITVKGRTFGTPRAGNAAYVSLFDSKVSMPPPPVYVVDSPFPSLQVLDFQRINHGIDFVPIIPWEFMGYSQVHGEIHIIEPGYAVFCPGDDDDTDAQCTDKTVPNIIEGSFDAHFGPYNGVMMGAQYCT